MTTGERVRIRREELNLSQEELSARLGYANRSAISKIETGGDKISLKKINRLALALEVNPQWLMGWEGDFPLTSELSNLSPELAIEIKIMELAEKLTKLKDTDRQLIVNMIDSLLEKDN